MKKLGLKIGIVALCALLVSSTVWVANAADSGEKAADTAENGTQESAAADDSEEEEAELTKDETVYVIAGNDGSVQKIIVSDWMKNALSADKITDVTELTGIENVKGDESYTMDGSTMAVWDAEGNDIYYQGNIEKELPVGLTVSYTLDGKSVSAEELAGKSGKVTIRFDYDNRQYETVSIDDKDEKIYVPFAMLTGMLLDSDTFRNVEVSNGKLLNDGDHTVVVGIAFPGLQEDLGIDEEQLDIPDYVEITADVTDFSLGNTVTIATNSVFNELDTTKFDSLDDMTASLEQLTDGMNQLLDGSSALYDGISTLLDKSQDLVDGINQLAEGAEQLKDATETVDSGVGTLSNGIYSLSSGLTELKDNNDTLNGGAQQVFETLLATAKSQLTAAGLTVPELTIDNYDEVLDKVVASLDETTVYNQALSQVTAAVEANRTAVEQAVTAAVREQVAAKVIPAATSGQMTKETYDAMVDAGALPAETQTAIEGAIDAQMQTSAIQTTISQQTEAQIQKLISDNMASDTVQAKLQAAKDGITEINSLKGSLDSYKTFYVGLQTYTAGVASAADGAAQLNSGAYTLKNGTAQLKEGMTSLYEGILQLKDGSAALIDGVSELKDGAMQLSDGLKQLNEEGIQKITDLVQGDLQNVIDRLKATADVSKDYRNFSGISDDTDGQVKFIYRTDEVK